MARLAACSGSRTDRSIVCQGRGKAILQTRGGLGRFRTPCQSDNTFRYCQPFRLAAKKIAGEPGASATGDFQSPVADAPGDFQSPIADAPGDCQSPVADAPIDFQ